MSRSIVEPISEDSPVGPPVDPWPRPLPARIPFSGAHVVLEPLHRRHAAELFEAAAGDDAGWTYLSYGPFPTAEAMTAFIASRAARHDPLCWAIRPLRTGRAEGWISLMEMEPENAAIELGGIWLAPALRRTRAATEAMFLLLAHAADALGYRRLVWKCDALNAASCRAARRLGFTEEGVLRAHKVVRGRRRDTAMFSITAEEWPARRAAIQGWLAPENFAADGSARQGLGDFRLKS